MKQDIRGIMRFQGRFRKEGRQGCEGRKVSCMAWAEVDLPDLRIGI